MSPQEARYEFPSESQRTQSVQHQTMTIYVKCCLPGNLIRNSVPKLLMWANHVGTLCLANTKSQSQKESSCLAWTTLYKYSRYILSHFYQLGNKGNTPEIQVPNVSQGPTLKANLSKDSGFKPAMLALFCTYSFCLIFSTKNLKFS